MTESASPTILTIAGFDPSSGAGVTADLAVIASHHFFGTSCITGLTVQSTLGVRALHPVDAGLVRATLDCLEADLPASGIKIGMLATADTVEAVASFVRQLRRSALGQGSGTPRLPVVLDPVLRSSSGRELLSASGLRRMREDLLPLVDWITPNLLELSILADREVRSKLEMEEAARELAAVYPGLGLAAKGGHLEGNPEDLVLSANGVATWLRGERIVSRATHGTGCAFASALVCGLLEGKDGVEAARAAKDYVTEAMRGAAARGSGSGPMDLYWPMRRVRS